MAARAFTATALLDGAVPWLRWRRVSRSCSARCCPPAPSRPRASTSRFAITTDRALGGSIRPGERVDLIATLPAGGTSQVAEDAVVIETRTETDGLLTETGRLVLTVRLQAQAEVLGLVEAVDEGQLTVVRSPVGTAP